MLHTRSFCSLPHLLSVFGLALLMALSIAPVRTHAQGSGDLLMITFPSRDFTGTPITLGPVTVIDQSNLNPGGRGNNFSVRVEGFIRAETSGTYAFETFSDDGVRLFIDGTPVINNYTDHAATIDIGTINLVAGQWYPLLLEHYERGGQQRLRLRWQPPGATGFVYPPTTVLSQSEPISAPGVPTTQDGRVAEIIAQEAARAMRADIVANQRANQDARARHATALRCSRRDTELALRDLDLACPDTQASRGATPLQFDGALTARNDMADLQGSFFGASEVIGGARTLYSGDLDFTRFEGGDVSAIFSARYAREQMRGDSLLGYFLGLNLNHSDVSTLADGTRTGYGVFAGVYMVDQLTEALTWDGFLSIGTGRNNLDVQDGGDQISGTYSTASILVGAALTGSHTFERFELRPELNLSYGYTDIGTVALTGGATPIVDAGGVRLGRLSFEPDLVIPLKTGQSRFDTREFWITPSFTCEYQKTTLTEENCGGGLAIEWTANRTDGLLDASVRLSREILGGEHRDSVGFRLESAF